MKNELQNVMRDAMIEICDEAKQEGKNYCCVAHVLHILEWLVTE